MKRAVIAALAIAVAIAAIVYWRRRAAAVIVYAPAPQVIAEIDDHLRAMAAKGMAASVVLEDHGELLLDKAYGLADRTSKRTVTTATGFDIGSLVKTFTAIAVLKLETQGRLRRSDPIGRYLPGVPPDKAAITVQQLLTHSSGLPDIVDAHSNPVTYTPDFDYEPVGRDEIVRRAMAAKLVHPGYSNLGFSLLGVIIENASGVPYEQYVQQVVFRPAKMLRTGYLGPRWTSAELAVGYRNGERWGTPLDHRWLPDGPSWNLRANGGMLSTAEDLQRFLAALARRELLTPAEASAFEQLYVHRNRRGARTLSAAGSNEVFDACYLQYLDEHRTLVMLTSSDDHRAEEIVPELAKEMRRIIARHPTPPPRSATPPPAG